MEAHTEFPDSPPQESPPSWGDVPETTAVPVTSVEQWAGHKRHTVTLLSGAVVEIEIPNLPKMIALGQVPNALMSAAMQFAQKPKVTPELLQEQYEFTKYLASETVKVPAVRPEDVEALPTEDVEMIIEFATRQRDMDAVGHHLAGLEKIESFRRIRRIPDLDSDLERL
jgi:hypothetical protein